MPTSKLENPNSPLKAWTRALEKTAPIARNPSRTWPVLIDSLATEFAAAPALISERETMTYSVLAARSRAYTRWALNCGIAFGDVVCLVMPNCAEYLAVWLGITRLGGIVALVNTNLTGQSLAHSINIVAPKHVIVGAELAPILAAARPSFTGKPECWVRGSDEAGFRSIDPEIDSETGDSLEAEGYRRPTITDRALYIYTSGTTGLPKAAAVSHFRLMQWSHWFAGMMDTRASDRMYDCLPMYHAVGGIVAIGAVLINGGRVVLRRQFSASRFWDDIVEQDCTLFQYIGELCRYLVNTPVRARETEHRIRLACGNGLRPDIWEAFERRFRIPQILEYYAATEATFSLYNCEGKPGAIGRIPSFLAHRFPVELIKFDPETGEPVRSAEGRCVRCAANEIGEAVGKIAKDESGAGGRYEGYTDDAASEKKVLRNVFAPGDAWFRTGDLMRKDEKGYFYFVDRVGDTFRWKGENVSATEVAETISACPGVLEAVVYGVAIPQTDGRAGMAAIVTGDGFELSSLRQYLAERLPDYARPLFLRILADIEKTTTFRPRKQALMREAYNPAVTTDSLYFDDRERDAFVKIDPLLYERIETGKLRV